MDRPGSNINQTEKKQYCMISLIWGFPGGSDGKESTCNAGDLASIPGLGRSPGEGNGSPLQYSGLENSMDREAWQATSMGWQRVRQDWVTFTHSQELQTAKGSEINQCRRRGWALGSDIMAWILDRSLTEVSSWASPSAVLGVKNEVQAEQLEADLTAVVIPWQLQSSKHKHTLPSEQRTGPPTLV